jgi:hypothetical protein
MSPEQVKALVELKWSLEKGIALINTIMGEPVKTTMTDEFSSKTYIVGGNSKIPDEQTADSLHSPYNFGTKKGRLLKDIIVEDWPYVKWCYQKAQAPVVLTWKKSLDKKAVSVIETKIKLDDVSGTRQSINQNPDPEEDPFKGVFDGIN